MSHVKHSNCSTTCSSVPRLGEKALWYWRSDTRSKTGEATLMNRSTFRQSVTIRRSFCASALFLLLGFGISNLTASPCTKNGAERNAWLRQRVNVLVRAARAAYEDENAQRLYERV